MKRGTDCIQLKARGFTLIEVMLAMAVLAIIGMASASVFQQMTQAESRSSERHALLAELQFALLIIDRDVRQLVARNRRAEGQQESFYISNDSRLLESDSGGLAFVRAGWVNPQQALPRSELQPVVYRVRDQVLQRLSLPFVDSVSGQPQVQALLTGVENFEVQFTTPGTGTQVSRWQQAEQLPEQVRIRIEHAQLGVIERVLLTSGAQPLELVNE
ncbi:type II secretion system protein GspJ [Aliidiomarina taiwanensis]|uniref:Type II secretion system protein J n=1 Tax=Aliidiomarina taiwanensis TaxID=946228 RepID=A0A432X7Z2_9GAMM|nr:type II secretion system minor pseudopilin GspJ [Aliidiomarina taiwanensis]RUO42989.1 type II secretion system protein GspJ [Aliidiomarina taiwanensis]